MQAGDYITDAKLTKRDDNDFVLDFKLTDEAGNEHECTWYSNVNCEHLAIDALKGARIDEMKTDGRILRVVFRTLNDSLTWEIEDARGFTRVDEIDDSQNLA